MLDPKYLLYHISELVPLSKVKNESRVKINVPKKHCSIKLRSGVTDPKRQKSLCEKGIT
jgi:hypothetical protein